MSQSNAPAERDDPKLRQILDEAAHLPADRRPGFLDEACGGDAELRAEVESLLITLDQADGILANPTVAPEPIAGPPEAPGSHIGPYKLLQKIGEGGMGVVYMAEQQHPVVRRVAVKVIKLGMDTRQVIARFEAERQALALMDHPNIAKVLDAGATGAGRPYFVMELVHGVSITEYCDTNHLTPRQRLELFVPVCRAVQHAHQKGIIHRDLKPSNVLVTLHDGVPVPKVIDFGVAKATAGRLTDKTLFTEFKQFVGTPQYMSPEQAEMSGLDVDTRADVYALGVLLYELLTGTTPFDEKILRQAAYAEIQRIIREVEPPRPSTRLSTLGDTLTAVAARRSTDPKKLGALVRGDLDWIVMRCLEKDRTRRYETANAVAMDVQRHLKDEPVEVSPPSASYRLRKLARKYRRQAAALVAIACALVLGILGTSIGMVRAEMAVGRAKTAETVAEQRKSAAENALEEATRNAARADAVNTFMKKMLASPVRSRGFLRPDDVRMVSVLEEAADSLDTELKGQPAAQAQVRDTIGMTFFGLGLLWHAQKHLRLAHGAAVEAEGDEAELAVTIGVHLALVLGQRQVQPDWWNEIIVNQSEATRVEGEILIRRTYEVARRRFGADRDVTVQAAVVLASYLPSADAAGLLQEFVRKAKETGGNDETVFGLFHTYAKALADLGRMDEAENIQTELIGLHDKKPGTSWAVNEAEVLLLYAQILRARGKLSEAKEAYGKAIAFQRQKFNLSHPVVVDTMSQYAAFLEGTGDYRGALAIQQELMETWRKLDRAGSSSYCQGLLNTARLWLRVGGKDEAVRAENEAFVSAQVQAGFTPAEWFDEWVKLLLADQCGPDKDWHGVALRANVWCALLDHLRDKPGGAGLCLDAIDWDGLRFRLERWTAAERFALICEGSFRELRGVADPPPGLYRLSMDVPRLVSKETQHAESWLLFTPFGVDVHGPTTERDHTAACKALLRMPAAEHRKTGSLALVNAQAHRSIRNPPVYALVGCGSIELPAGRYRFSITSEAGLRLYVDGRAVIDCWTHRSNVCSDHVVLDLGSGAHEIRVESFQSLYASHVWLQVAPTTQPSTTPLPLLAGDYPRPHRVQVPDLESRLAAEIERRPNVAAPVLVRARFFARRGRFEEAGKDYTRALRLDSSNQWVWFNSALVQLQAGNHEEYRRQCREMLNLFGTATNRHACEQVVKACTAVPDAVPDFGVVMTLADRCVAPGDHDHDQLAWRAQAKGMAEYRAGHFDTAVDWLSKGTKVDSQIAGAATTNFYLAMAEFKRGRPAAARAAMRDGMEIVERDGPRDGQFSALFMEWIIVLHAQREAAALLGDLVPRRTTHQGQPELPETG